MMQTTQKVSHYSLAMLLSLYVAQGLPTGFMTQALPTLLRHYGVSLTQIGVSGLLMMPWALKFLWAPYVDRYGVKKLGHYRSWILFTQSLSIVCLMIMAFLPVQYLGDISTLWGMFIVLFTLNLLCATQDVATDGLAVNILKNGAVHWGNTFQVIGSRLGFIVGGGAVLYAIDVLSWQTTFLLLAFGMFMNTWLILLYKEPTFCTLKITNLHYQKADKPRLALWQKIKKIYGHLWYTPYLRIWLLVVLTYKVADGIAGPILKPMMIDLGLSLSQIGIKITMLGASCALIGALCAGWLIQKFPIRYMFLIFSLLQITVWAYYIFIANHLEDKLPIEVWHVYLANALEEFTAAMSLVAMLSLIMKHTRTQFAATDFTLQVALMSIVGGGLYTLGGVFADYMGYSLVLYWVLFLSFVCFLPKLYWVYMNKVD